MHVLSYIMNFDQTNEFSKSDNISIAIELFRLLFGFIHDYDQEVLADTCI